VLPTAPGLAPVDRLSGIRATEPWSAYRSQPQAANAAHVGDEATFHGLPPRAVGREDAQQIRHRHVEPCSVTRRDAQPAMVIAASVGEARTGRRAATWLKRTTPARIDQAYRSLSASTSNPDRVAQSVQLNGNMTPEAEQYVYASPASSAAPAMLQCLFDDSVNRINGLWRQPTLISDAGAEMLPRLFST
jgi:hypothetical protein